MSKQKGKNKIFTYGGKGGTPENHPFKVKLPFGICCTRKVWLELEDAFQVKIFDNFPEIGVRDKRKDYNIVFIVYYLVIESNVFIYSF